MYLKKIRDEVKVREEYKLEEIKLFEIQQPARSLRKEIGRGQAALRDRQLRGRRTQQSVWLVLG